MYSVSGAKPQPPNVFLDIIGAYVSAGLGKVAVIFFCHTPKSWGATVPSTPKVWYPVPPVSYAYLCGYGSDQSSLSLFHQEYIEYIGSL